MKLAVFDLDGVILDIEIGGFKYLAKSIGKQREVGEIDEEYQRRKHLGPYGLEQLASLFEGFSYKRLRELSYDICKANLMKGARETIKTLKARQYSIAFLSSNPLIITEQLKDILAADFICGNELEFKDGICTGILLRKVDRYTKAEELDKIIKENRISRSTIYIIGDSITDIPMSQYGTFISFNSHDENVDKAAKYVIKEKDLTKILQFIK